MIVHEGTTTSTEETLALEPIFSQMETVIKDSIKNSNAIMKMDDDDTTGGSDACRSRRQ
jgi:hypothetical protein